MSYTLTMYVCSVRIALHLGERVAHDRFQDRKRARVKFGQVGPGWEINLVVVHGLHRSAEPGACALAFLLFRPSTNTDVDQRRSTSRRPCTHVDRATVIRFWHALSSLKKRKLKAHRRSMARENAPSTGNRRNTAVHTYVEYTCACRVVYRAQSGRVAHVTTTIPVHSLLLKLQQ